MPHWTLLGSAEGLHPRITDDGPRTLRPVIGTPAARALARSRRHRPPRTAGTAKPHPAICAGIGGNRGRDSARRERQQPDICNPVCVRGFIGVTDRRWTDYLAAGRITEANFWLPSTKTAFRALEVGEPFLFKTHYPDNRIVGGGYFEHFTQLRCSQAWDFLGTGNGVPDLASLVAAVHRYRHDDGDRDPLIGCVILNDVAFFDRASPPPGPASFASNIVRGKGYRLPSGDSEVEHLFGMLLAAGAAPAPTPAAMWGGPVEVRPRLGQGGFRAVVLDAYSGRCAITGHKIRPTLQAAHIMPVTAGGQHRVDNGLLLRSDVHTMFDRGYLALDQRYRLRVSPRLRQEFGNGEEFYAAERTEIALPARRVDRPAQEFLDWHRDSVFLAS